MPTQPDEVRKGLAICVPSSGRPVPIEWAWAMRFMDLPINLYGVYHSPRGLPVDEARNVCVEFAQEQKCKYMFFVDEDTVCPSETIRKFVFLMENNPGIDVLGGVYFSKSIPAAPLVFRGNGAGSYWDWKVGELFWVTGIGMGCTMIRMSVFDKIEKPYFLTIKADGHIDGVGRVEAWTEDLYFCEKVLKAYGWSGSDDALREKQPDEKPIYADAGTICEHFDVQSGKIFSLPQSSKPAIRNIAVGDKLIIDIGCGEIASKMTDGLPVRVDMRDDVNADYRCDVRSLPFATESVDIVYSSHTLEHFERKQIPMVLAEWTRVLKVGGEMRLIVPDLYFAARQIMADGNMDDRAMNVLYGEQNHRWNFHRTGFTAATLRKALEEAGLEVKSTWSEEPFNLFAEAVKKEATKYVGTGQGRPIEKDPEPVEVEKEQK